MFIIINGLVIKVLFIYFIYLLKKLRRFDDFQMMYKNLVSATKPIESGLHRQLATHLNSEIALNTINDFADAMKWMRSTFLYVRAAANPKYYGIQSTCMKTIEQELKGKLRNYALCCDE